MSNSVSFRERTEGVTTRMEVFGELDLSAVGNTITDPRLGYAKGQVTLGEPAEGFYACGPGTGFPLKVTVRQLAEIMYRVRDSTVSGGSISGSYDVSNERYTNTGTVELAFKGGTRPAQMASYSSSGGRETRRAAQCAISIGEPHETDMGGRFGPLYDVSPGIKARDPISELAMWTPSPDLNYIGTGGQDFWVGPYISSGMSYSCRGSTPLSTTDLWANWYGHACSNYRYREQIFEDPPEDPPPPIDENYYNGSFCHVSISPLVAYTGSSPFDPAGSLYLRVHCQLVGDFHVPSPGGGNHIFQLNSRMATGRVATSAKLKFMLSAATPEVSCPLYFESSLAALELGSVTDLVVTADRWWDY